jgi:hypothetical protein
MTTLDCVLHSECAAGAISTCYCGTASLSACSGNPAPGPINGACASQIAAGLNFPVTDGTDNTKNLTQKALASGRAVDIFQHAQSNGCKNCFQ